MMYYARGLKDILKKHKLSYEFFEQLDSFQINCIESYLQQSIDDQMGMLGEVEYYNYQLFESYKQTIGSDLLAEFFDHKKAS